MLSSHKVNLKSHLQRGIFKQNESHSSKSPFELKLIVRYQKVSQAIHRQFSSYSISTPEVVTHLTGNSK